MEIDSTVSKQTTILIDLHPSPSFFFFFLKPSGGGLVGGSGGGKGGGDARIPFLSGVSIDHPPCVSLRMCFPSFGDNGFLTTPIPGFNVA